MYYSCTPYGEWNHGQMVQRLVQGQKVWAYNTIVI